MTGGEAVVAALRALGVEHVFGIVSVHNLPIADAIARTGGIRWVPVRHEQGAVHAADGYARATGRLGVAVTSTGPGAANGMNGLFEAGFASSPVLMITGQVESDVLGRGKGALHEAERQLEMLRSVTRRAETVRHGDEIATTVMRAGLDARSGRPQPAAVEIPIDLQYGEATVGDLGSPAPLRPAPAPAAVAAASGKLAAATRPLLWAGGGVVRAGAGAALTALAERLRAPVVTTVNGRGAIAEDHELCIGPFTAMGPVADVIAEADLVLAVGTRFQAGATRNWVLPIPAPIVHVDADPLVVGRSYPAAVTVIADAGLALEALLADLPGDARADDAFAAKAREAGASVRDANRLRIGPDHDAIQDAIRHFLPRDGIVVRDATVPAYFWADRLLPVYGERCSINSTSAAIGPGLPLAIGAAIGTGRRTVLIQGDGGFMLNLSEMATAVEERVPVVICVFNDRGYGILRTIQAGRFAGRTTAVDLVTPDFVKLADSFGMAAQPVASADEFTSALKVAIDRDGPTLLDIDMTALAPMAGFGR